MHIIESEEVPKTMTTLAPLTTLSRNDAHYTCYNDLSAVAAAAVKATHMWTRPSFGRMSQCNKWGRVRINHGQPQNIRKLPWQEGVNNSMVALEVRIQSIVLSPLDRVLDLADFSLLVVSRWL